DPGVLRSRRDDARIAGPFPRSCDHRIGLTGSDGPRTLSPMVPAPRNAPGRPSRAAAQYAWTGPLHPLQKRYQRLAPASLRLGAIAIASLLFIAIARARAGFGTTWIAVLAALAVAGAAGLLLGRAANRAARAVTDEIARIEEEATRHLPG